MSPKRNGGLVGVEIIGTILTMAGVLAAILVLALIIAVVEGVQKAKRFNEDEPIYRERLRKRVAPIVDQHLPALLQRRRVLVQKDVYGLVDESRWEKELARFFDQVVVPSAGIPTEDDWLLDERKRWLSEEVILPAIRRAADEQDKAFSKRFDPAMSPTEYEHFCASRLRKVGWKATVTQASGDQGADIIAVREGETMVVQCKMYSKPVGNKCVQEVVAARSHYGAKRAVVIATKGYTKSAQALAATNDVDLLDHDSLSMLA
jgi:restriction system protein